MSQEVIKLVEQPYVKTEVPQFEIGDTVDVHTKILEGNKERIQIFTGTVIARNGSGAGQMFTVRRIVAGEGVERKFPLHSPRSLKRSSWSCAALSVGPSSTTSAIVRGKAVRLKERRTIAPKK